MVSCSVFLPPQWYGSPGSTPFPSICKLLAAFLKSSLVFDRSLQRFWLPASHLLGTCDLLDDLRSTHTPSKYLRATYSHIYMCYVSTSYIYIYIYYFFRSSIWAPDGQIVLYIIYIIYIYTHTSSTAQGGGGSFKNSKPIGEVGCCESLMAERIHWWTERWLKLCFFEWLQWMVAVVTSPPTAGWSVA